MERYYYTSVSKKLKSLKVAKSKDLDVDFVEVGGDSISCFRGFGDSQKIFS